MASYSLKCVRHINVPFRVDRVSQFFEAHVFAVTNEFDLFSKSNLNISESLLDYFVFFFQASGLSLVSFCVFKV
jgi:hypothetical protein